MIKFFNVDRQYQQDREIYLDLADLVYSTGQVINGEYCRKLENSLKTRTGRKHCVLTASGTDALAFVGNYLGTTSSNIVLFPELSFPATNNGFVRELNPWRVTRIYVSTDANGNMDLNALDRRITPLSKEHVVVVVWVNLFGHTVDFDQIKLLQEKHPHVEFVEDAAQSFGASWHSTPSGSAGIASCLSFDPTKNLNAFGLGGAVLTDSDELAGAVDTHRRPHTARWINHGYNSQINEIDAAMLWWKLENRFDSWQHRRTEIANYYTDQLQEHVEVVQPQNNCTSAWHKFVIKHHARDSLKQKLKDHGVDTRVHYPKTLSGNENSFTRSCLSLPIYPELTDSEVEHVVESTVSTVKLLS